MTNPRYRPAEFTTEPGSFGRARTVEWRTHSVDKGPLLEAAKIQHRFSVAIRNRALVQFGSLKSYARAADIDYPRLTQVLAGKQVMRLEDIATAQLVLGEIVPIAQTNSAVSIRLDQA